MAMDYMNLLRQGYQHNTNMSPYDGPPHGLGGHGYQYMYTEEQLYMMAHLQHRATMGAGVAQGNGQQGKLPTDPKPRLSKEEVDLLEQEFQKNSKPSSGRKREIADHLKVDHPRINNWFQNRRAKEKQMRKAREFQAQQDAERGVSTESNSADEDQDEDSVGEYFGSSNQIQPVQPSSAAFPTSPTVDGQNEPVPALTDDSPISTPASPLSHPINLQPTQVAETPLSTSLPTHVTHHAELDFSPVTNNDFLSDTPDLQVHFSDGLPPQPLQTFSTPDSHADFDKINVFSHFGHGLAPDSIVAPVPAFPSQLLLRDPDSEQVHTQSPLQQSSPMESHVKTEPVSPVVGMMQSPNMSADLRFKSPPPPSNLATRRNKGIPTLLNATALRSFSYGPKTGLDMTKHSDHASPMRRIASATGTFHGRVQKASVGSAPRSPLYLERTKEALMRSLQGTQSPVMGSINTALSPVTPGGDNLLAYQGIREATVSSSASDDEQRYTLGGSQHPFFRIETNLKTPPGTPGVVRGYPEQMLTIDSAWNYVPQDEPLITPSLGSFGSEEFSMAPAAPGYVARSQPPTPSFTPNVGPAYFPWGMNGNGPSSHEYTFPGESYMSDSSAQSPTQAKLKQIQFTQNVTPQNYCGDR